MKRRGPGKGVFHGRSYKSIMQQPSVALIQGSGTHAHPLGAGGAARIQRPLAELLGSVYSGSTPQPQGNHQAPSNNIPLGQEQTDSPGQLGTRKEHLCEGEHPDEGVSRSSPACCKPPSRNLPKTTLWRPWSII